MNRTRSPNIVSSLLKNSRSSFMLAIEIHNKPICDYRIQWTVIFLIHSWELILKWYTYKYLNDKKVLLKDKDNRYQQLSQIIEKIYHSDTKNFRILKESIDILNAYRNLIIHSNNYENMDQLIFELIAKSVLLYRDFIQKYFPKHDLKWIEDTYILPIAFKVPYTPLDILTGNFASVNTSKPVLEFIEYMKTRIISMSNDGIEESIFINIRTEFISGNNMKNSNIRACIVDWEEGVTFQKEIKTRLVSDKSAQPMRGLLSKEEREERFIIPTKRELTTKVRTIVGSNKWTQKWWTTFFNQITKLLESEHEWSEWYPNIGTSWKMYTNNFYELVIAKYE